MALHWLAAPLLITALTVWTTLAVQRIWPLAVTRHRKTRQFVVDWWESRPVTERRAYPVRAFIHLPEGQEPPDPVFQCRSNGVKVLRPWRDKPVLGSNDVTWACSAFAYPEGDGNRYGITKAIKGGGPGVFAVQFSANGESWHIGSANADDRYSRFRSDGGHLTQALPLDRKRIRTPGNWFELFAVHDTEQNAYQMRPVEPFRLQSIRELRAELHKRDIGQHTYSQRVAGDILYSPHDLRLMTTSDNQQFLKLPSMSYLRFAKQDEGGWSLSVGNARPMDIRSINDKGIDLVLLEDEPDSGIVDSVAYTSYGLGPFIHNASLKLYWR
ncbi:MAG: hypothetical protein F4010_05235 [Cenarchaeum sp. SB0669_bin_11]|nr:hypothetical protein [Cenarchaeum sp. SB0669_bin_11]